jgi:hypothetical protein
MAPVPFRLRTRPGPHVALRTRRVSSPESTRAIGGFREENESVPEALGLVVSKVYRY